MAKPRPIFDDMPAHVKEKVLQTLDLNVRIKMRQFSKSIRDIVDKFIKDNMELEFFTSPLKVTMKMRENDKTYRIEYINEDTGCKIESWKIEKREGNIGLIYRRKKFFLKDENFLKVALSHLAYIVKAPKRHFEFLGLTNHNQEEIWQLDKFLPDLKHQLSCKTLLLEGFGNENSVVSVLSSLQPGILKDIFIHFDFRYLTVSHIANLEQWKRAVMVFFVVKVSEPFVASDWTHLKTLRISTKVVTLENAELLFQSALNRGEQFEKCEILIEELDCLRITEHFSQLPGFRRDFQHLCIDIPGTEDELVITPIIPYFMIWKRPRRQ